MVQASIAVVPNLLPATVLRPPAARGCAGFACARQHASFDAGAPDSASGSGG